MYLEWAYTPYQSSQSFMKTQSNLMQGSALKWSYIIQRMQQRALYCTYLSHHTMQQLFSPTHSPLTWWVSPLLGVSPAPVPCCWRSCLFCFIFRIRNLRNSILTRESASICCASCNSFLSRGWLLVKLWIMFSAPCFTWEQKQKQTDYEAHKQILSLMVNCELVDGYNVLGKWSWADEKWWWNRMWESKWPWTWLFNHWQMCESKWSGWCRVDLCTLLTYHTPYNSYALTSSHWLPHRRVLTSSHCMSFSSAQFNPIPWRMETAKPSQYLPNYI